MESNDKTVLVNFNKQEEETSRLDELYMRLGQAYYEGGFEDPLPELLPFLIRLQEYEIKSRKNRKILFVQDAECQQNQMQYLWELWISVEIK